MVAKECKITDGNGAAASVAFRSSEVIVIYPITPSSTMAELSDEWSADGQKNLWGDVPQVTQMQSEAGVAGALHGALQAGSLATSFTCSQGLLLMIPNLYKIAGELTPFVLHVSARALATHALSIFGDHSDVMACRQTGVAMLAGGTVQEAHDMAAIAHVATLKSRIPFIHFFDGFRTSHEINRIEALSDRDLLSLLDAKAIAAHRGRALSPDHPVVRGTAQNPDTFFQSRERANLFYDVCPLIVAQAMDRFAALTGRHYQPFDYHGHPEADRVIIIMGSGSEIVHEAVDTLLAKGERVGVLKVHLYRPFSVSHFMAALPQTAHKIAVLDRCKESGAPGEPLFLDIVAAFNDVDTRRDLNRLLPTIIGGRYGLGSKEFTPAMAIATFKELSQARPMQKFTVGIKDDVTDLSLKIDESSQHEDPTVMGAVFYGLGSDGTVGANKNSIKIIGQYTQNQVQAYFVYDSKKSGSTTVSHLRFGPKRIRSSYLIRRAGFVACHQFNLISRPDVLGVAAQGGTLLINAPYPASELWQHLPAEVQQQIIDKKLKVYTINADKAALDLGLGGRINTLMQTAFFTISKVMPVEQAYEAIKLSIAETYGDKGPKVLAKNNAAVDAAPQLIEQVNYPDAITTEPTPLKVPVSAPEFVRKFTVPLMAGQGDSLPVSSFPVDGTYPVGTSKWEKRSVADSIPVWDEKLCIQCNKCAVICPHAAIRPKVYGAELIENAPEGWVGVDYKAPDFKGMKFTLAVAPDDCTGCSLCAEICPAIDKQNPSRTALEMKPIGPIHENERAKWNYFLDIPEADRSKLRMDIKGSQFCEPLFEFSGACSGCGETPYIKLMTQLFGDRLMIANATGCSSIYGGNLPTTPYRTNREGHGPAWSNSLFEDNAEFGMGMRLGVDALVHRVRSLLARSRDVVGNQLTDELLNADQSTEAGIRAQRSRVSQLRTILSDLELPDTRTLEELSDYLVRKSVWIIGGDGWAYDIGFGGLDHVIATGQNVKILILDTEVYSNTGGQQSKSTPLGASAKFASSGKKTGKKDMGLIAMSYGHVYVASIAVGAKDTQTLKAIQEAEDFPGPAIIIAYGPCIAHGFAMEDGPLHQQNAVASGYWPLYRFDPRRVDEGKSPLQWDAAPPKLKLLEFLESEGRFRTLQRADAARFAEVVDEAQETVARRILMYQRLAEAFVKPTTAEAAV